MKIHYYGVVWNEAPMLPYFFRHYDSIVERYVIFDDGSDDGTLEILTRHPRVEIRPFASENESFIETALILFDQVWKQSRGVADLVLSCDVDEFLWHPQMKEFLSKSLADGCTIFRPRGWQMFHESFPITSGQIYEEVHHGCRDKDFDKVCLFDPNRIDEIHWAAGGHTSAPTGQVKWGSDDQLLLLHFKLLGVPYVVARYAALKTRLGRRDREKAWGWHYGMSEQEIREMFSTAVLEDLAGRLCPNTEG
ncbi:MAG: glycosyltransferase family 2 protein [Desulfobacterales bacterium]|jgi:hypothetical protein|nr:glycosyltransferase family 2 protein [Desulfobacterales bacterium]